jgi:hypothetical protein
MPSVEKFTLLFEKDLRNVLTKIGYPQEMADWAHSVNSKYSPFIARAAFGKPDEQRGWQLDGAKPEEHKDIINQTIQRVDPLKDRLVNIIRTLFQEQNKPQLPVGPNEMDLTTANALVQQLQYMRDWWNNPAVTGINPRALNWEQAYQAAKDWHEEQATKAGGALTTQEGQSIIHQFEDGSYWVDLDTDYDRGEADAMGHCGSASEGTLYSLRNRKGEPFITADIDTPKKVSGQIFGRANTKPKAEYHGKILTLLGKLDVRKLKVVNHGGHSSLAIGDIDEDEWEWFEEEFGYRIEQEGCSEEDIKEAERIFNDAGANLALLSVWADFSSTEEYINAELMAYIDLEEMGFEINEAAKGEYSLKDSYTRGFNKNPIKDAMPSYCEDEWSNEGTYRCSHTMGSFNVAQASGDTDGGYTRFTNIVSWANEIVSGLESQEDDLIKAFPAFIKDIVEGGIIYEDDLSILFSEMDNESPTQVTPTKGNNFRVTSTISCPQLTAAIIKRFGLKVDPNNVRWLDKKGARSLEAAEAKVRNAFNKKKTFEALLFQAKGYNMEQLEFEFMNSLGESTSPNWMESGHLYVKEVSNDTVTVTMTFDPCDEVQREESIRKIKYLQENGEGLAKTIMTLLGWYGRGGEQSAGAYVKRRGHQVESFTELVG